MAIQNLAKIFRQITEDIYHHGNTINLNLDKKRLNILGKCIEKRPTKAGMTKLEIMKKLKTM